MAKPILSAEHVRELLHYNPESGAFTWAKDVGCGHRRQQVKRAAGETAGYVNTYGYLMIGIEGANYRASRLAWVHFYGEAAPTKLWHVDGDPGNIAITNLAPQNAGGKPTAQRVRQVFDYNADTGIFKWKSCLSDRSMNGEMAGGLDSIGYWMLSVDGGRFHAHRIAWLYVYGEWPKGVIDHINGDRSDNRIANLRDVTHAANIQNQRKASRANRSSGLLGAHWSERRGKWHSCITANGVAHNLGYFVTAEEAHQAYLAAKRRLHPGNTL